MAKQEPSIDQWLAEAKQDPKAAQCGMFLTHNGVVRVTPKQQVREGVEGDVYKRQVLHFGHTTRSVPLPRGTDST